MLPGFLKALIERLFRRRKNKLSASTISKGARAERFARRWFAQQGTRVLAGDLSDKHGQLDLLIATADGGVAVVEVRSHSSAQADHQALMPWSKQQQVIHTARRLLPRSKYWKHGDPLRFDACFVRLDEKGEAVSVEHIPNAFQPTQRDWF